MRVFSQKPFGGSAPRPREESTSRRALASGALALDDVVCLKQAATTRFVRLREIRWIEAAGNCSEVFLSSGQSLLSDESFRRWEARLPAAAFARVHRAALVGLQHVSALSSRGGELVLELRGSPPAALEVSRRCARALRRRLR